MELFYGNSDGDVVRLSPEESGHCIRVLRHRLGDEIFVIDGAGTLMRCTLTLDDPRGAAAAVVERFPEWGGHPYRLTVGCCPTKNLDRFEWFIEKATELGIDEIVPLIGDRSERRIFKADRARRLALSATKQSLKARIPTIADPQSVRAFLLSAGSRCAAAAGNATGDAAAGNATPGGSASNTTCGNSKHDAAACSATANGSIYASARDNTPAGELRLIAYCFEDDAHPRISIKDALATYNGRDITILIGPEGDFSPEEANLALNAGFIPVHLGPSRLRTETAAVTATAAVYMRYL